MRKLIIFAALFLLLSVPAVAATVDVTVTVTGFCGWDYPADSDFDVVIVTADDYQVEWEHFVSTIIKSNQDWEIKGSVDAWDWTSWNNNNGDPSDWEITAQWDAYGTPLLLDATPTQVYAGDAGVHEKNMKLRLTGPSIDEGYGVADCTVTLTLSAT